MDTNKEQKQRKEFCDILFELAKSQETLQDAYYRSNMYKRLEALYDAPTPDKRFRHFYSDIFSVLTQIQQNSLLGDINILGQNLDVIRSGYKSRNKADDGRSVDVSDAIKKLYDHVNLDIARILYSDAGDRKTLGETSITNLQTQINALQEDITKAQEIKQNFQETEIKILAVEKKLDKSQKEYITILGIFAAVVLAFTGGIAFSTSVLNNIAQSSVYRTIIISLIIGLVLINILFGLFYYVNKLVSSVQKIFPLILSNLILLVLLGLTVIAWNSGFVEMRNSRVHGSNIEMTTEENIIKP